MRQAALERRLFDLSARLVKARQELAVLDEQLELFDDMASQAQVDSVVRGNPSLYSEAKRHSETMCATRVTLCAEIARMEVRQERLIARLTAAL